MIWSLSLVKNCELNTHSSEYVAGCTQARSLCKSQNGTIFQTDPGLFNNRFKSCRMYDADFCEFVDLNYRDQL